MNAAAIIAAQRHRRHYNQISVVVNCEDRRLCVLASAMMAEQMVSSRELRSLSS